MPQAIVLHTWSVVCVILVCIRRAAFITRFMDFFLNFHSIKKGQINSVKRSFRIEDIKQEMGTRLRIIQSCCE